MTHHTCTTCGDKIPNGEAHIRSINFVQHAWCGFCWAVGAGEALLAEVTIPAQRRSALSERLEAVRRAS